MARYLLYYIITVCVNSFISFYVVIVVKYCVTDTFVISDRYNYMNHSPCFHLFSDVLDHVESRNNINSVAVFSFLKTVLANPFPQPGMTIHVKSPDLKTGKMDDIALSRPGASDPMLEYVCHSCHCLLCCWFHLHVSLTRLLTNILFAWNVNRLTSINCSGNWASIRYCLCSRRFCSSEESYFTLGTLVHCHRWLTRAWPWFIHSHGNTYLFPFFQSLCSNTSAHPFRSLSVYCPFIRALLRRCPWRRS